MRLCIYACIIVSMHKPYAYYAWVAPIQWFRSCSTVTLLTVNTIFGNTLIHTLCSLTVWSSYYLFRLWTRNIFNNVGKERKKLYHSDDLSSLNLRYGILGLNEVCDTDSYQCNLRPDWDGRPTRHPPLVGDTLEPTNSSDSEYSTASVNSVTKIAYSDMIWYYL